MKGSILEKYGHAKQPEPKPVPASEETGPEDLGAFGILRGVHERAIMLAIKHKDGKVSAFGYAWLDHVEFDPSVGIKLYFGGRVIKITGRNLNAEVRPNVTLVQGLLRHRVPWIQEADGPSKLEADRNTVVIEEITC